MNERICWYCKKPIEDGGYFKVDKKDVGLVDAHKSCHTREGAPKSNIRIKIRAKRGGTNIDR